VAERVDGSGGIKILINVLDHFESLSVEAGFFDKEVRDWWLDVKVDDFLPPCAGDGVSRRGDEELGVETRGVRVAAEAGVNDFLGFDPGVLVRNVFDPQVRGFVFDDDNPGGCGHGSGWRSRG
jgi:hypothetical protein